jgi:Ca2+-binding RTX toxin-like protein
MQGSRRVATLLVALGATLATAGGASAATIEIVGDAVVYKGTAASDFPNVEMSDGQLLIGDSAGFTSIPDSCTAAGEGSVKCPMPARYRAELGDGNDDQGFQWFDQQLPSTLTIELIGGGGNDALEPWDPGTGNPVGGTRIVEGGEGNDLIYGSLGTDVMHGGPGDDTVYGFGGADQVFGDEGNDTLSGERGKGSLPSTSDISGDVIDGGAGADELVDYDNPLNGVKVDVRLDGQANDGRSGENDNLVSIEDIEAEAAGSWTLSDADETLFVHGGDGDTTVRGLGGNDHLEGDNDVENLDGGLGDDHIEGGNNHDTLTGGPGQDRIYGDDADSTCGPNQSCKLPFGNDVIFARDGEVDTIDCGIGEDRAVVDTNDVVAANCEKVEKPAESETTTEQEGCRVPNVVNLKLKAALKKLRAAGCTVKTKRVKHKKIRKGRVVKTSRKAGAIVPKGKSVTAFVSRGRR